VERRKQRQLKKPTYRKMIVDALSKLQSTNKGGSSAAAIAKHIEKNIQTKYLHFGLDFSTL